MVGEGQLALTLGSQLQEHLELQMAAELMAAFSLRLPTLGVQALLTSQPSGFMFLFDEAQAGSRVLLFYYDWEG